MIDRIVTLVAVVSCAVAAPVVGGDWIVAPSYFTHDQTGHRVQQYTPIGPFYIYPSPDFQRSGYRHTRSSIQAGSSVDHYHLVEEWGRPVRPYDEWRFPYRPYSAPYGLWGPPYAGLGYGFGGGYGGGYGAGFPGGGFPGHPSSVQPFNGYGYGGMQPGVPYRGYQPWFDDRYPAFDDRAPWRNRAFPQQPNTRP